MTDFEYCDTHSIFQYLHVFSDSIRLKIAQLYVYEIRIEFSQLSFFSAFDASIYFLIFFTNSKKGKKRKMFFSYTLKFLILIKIMYLNSSRVIFCNIKDTAVNGLTNLPSRDLVEAHTQLSPEKVKLFFKRFLILKASLMEQKINGIKK